MFGCNTLSGPNCIQVQQTRIGPRCIINVQTVAQPQCFRPITRWDAICVRPTRFEPQCFQIPSPFCQFTPGCPIGPETFTPVRQPAFEQQGFGAAAPGGGGGFGGALQIAPTPATACFICPPLTSPQRCWHGGGGGGGGWGAGGGGGQTAATVCTQVGHQCQSAVDACPTRLCGGGGGGGGWGGGGGGGQTAATTCTQFGHQCQSAVDACPTRFCGGGAVGAQEAAPAPFTPATVCTQHGCPTYPSGDCTFFGCPPGGGGGGGHTAATVCTQFGHQCQSAVDACPTRLCGGGAVGAQQAAPAPFTPATVCTQHGCPTYPSGDCTFFGCPPGGGGGGGHTAATTCTQFGHQCQSAVDACPTRLCGQEAVGAAMPQTAATTCTQFGQQCLSAVDACWTRLCGGGQQPLGPTGWQGCGQHPVGPTGWQGCGQQPVDPTGWQGCGQQQNIGAGGHWPTPMTRCFVC